MRLARVLLLLRDVSSCDGECALLCILTSHFAEVHHVWRDDPPADAKSIAGDRLEDLDGILSRQDLRVVPEPQSPVPGVCMPEFFTERFFHRHDSIGGHLLSFVWVQFRL